MCRNKIIITLCVLIYQFTFSQSMKAHTKLGISEFSLIEIDSITFTVVEDTVDLNRRLLAYYPFNGNANDESGNGNNGTTYGPTLTDDRFGNPNSAYLFNGINAFIDLGNNFNLKPQLPFSFSV